MSEITPEAYCDVVYRLELERARYVVIGGIAVVLRGHIRPISDLDLAINSTPDEISRVMAVLGGLGFVPTIPLPLSALTVLRMFDRSQREVNAFARPYVPFAELWEGSELVRIGQGIARITSLKHLLRAKRICGRPQDLLDIKSLLLRSKPASRVRSGSAPDEQYETAQCLSLATASS